MDSCLINKLVLLNVLCLWLCLCSSYKQNPIQKARVSMKVTDFSQIFLNFLQSDVPHEYHGDKRETNREKSILDDVLRLDQASIFNTKRKQAKSRVPESEDEQEVDIDSSPFLKWLREVFLHPNRSTSNAH